MSAAPLSHGDACAQGPMLSLDEALARYAQIRPLAPRALAPEAALHHVLVEDVAAAVDLPMYTQSAVDGYA
ncbi:MAG: molybdopterin molybdotransferase MoeA, partial [Solimonas sp.]